MSDVKALQEWRSLLKHLLPVDGSSENQAGRKSGDFQLNKNFELVEDPTPAAVLVPIVARPSGPTVLLTERTAHLYDHAGQVSFPGGRVEKTDKDMIDTALRETEEEIGLQREYIEVLASLDDYRTGTGFVITPIIGWVRDGFELELDEFEVAEVFEIPLARVLNEDSFEIQTKFFRDRDHRFYVLEDKERYIWGATAGILRDLCHQLRALEVS